MAQGNQEFEVNLEPRGEGCLGATFGPNSPTHLGSEAVGSQR